MANCSDAYGTITLEGKWTLEMLSAMNIIKKEWASWTYNIVIDDDFTVDCTSLAFNGCGRWAFHANIRFLDAWTKDESKKNLSLYTSYELLTAEMERHGARIEFSYSDEERGSLYLCDGVARINSESGSLVIETLSEQYYDYCWEECLKRDFCDESMIEELEKEIFDLFHVKESQREALSKTVEQWIIANTFPGALAENLNESQRSELKAIILQNN